MTAGVACLEGVGWGKVISSLLWARLPLLLPGVYSYLQTDQVHSHHRTFALAFSFA